MSSSVAFQNSTFSKRQIDICSCDKVFLVLPKQTTSSFLLPLHFSNGPSFFVTLKMTVSDEDRWEGCCDSNHHSTSLQSLKSSVVVISGYPFNY